MARYDEDRPTSGSRVQILGGRRRGEEVWLNVIVVDVLPEGYIFKSPFSDDEGSLFLASDEGRTWRRRSWRIQDRDGWGLDHDIDQED